MEFLLRKMRGLTAKLLGQKSEKTKPKDEHTPPESEHEPHRGSTKGPFMCTREDCWCLDGQLPNHRPGIDLAGASARLLEASFRQTLSKCIKTDGQTVGVTLFLGVDWKERGGSDVFPHEVAGELVRVLGGDEMAELVQAFGAERWNHREEEGTKKKMKKETKVHVNLHSLALDGVLMEAWNDSSSQFHKGTKWLAKTKNVVVNDKAHAQTVLSQLLQEGADVNVFDRSGITPLHYAARHLNVEQVQLLLDQKADPTIVDVYGNSALHFAAVAASTWRPDASEKGRGNGFQTHSMCEICGSRHSNAGKCKLKSLSVEIKEKLTKSSKKAKTIIKFQNTLGHTAQKAVMDEDRFKDIDAQCKKRLEGTPTIFLNTKIDLLAAKPNPEVEKHIQDTRKNAERLQRVAKFFA